VIFNRTKNDVENALKIRDEKIKTFQELTDDDIEVLERGFFTLNSIQRIQEKQEDLKGLFAEIGYYNTPIIIKEFDDTMFFSEADFQQLINNVNVLRNAFFAFSSTPKTPPISYHYDDINALEKILYDLDVMINYVKSLYAECGNVECGEIV
jgi:hypothetical protein